MPLRHFFGLRGAAAEARVGRSCSSRCRFPAPVLTRYPGELSGGERQRVAIARALAAEPDMLDLRRDHLRARRFRAGGDRRACSRSSASARTSRILFVTHNLALVRTIADRVAVLDRGRLVESGGTARVLDAPEAEYTQRLLADTPSL